ncbi:MAG: hypothetical protein H0V13_09685 [Nocardioidaceae bacterium]|nr:hypothetical protein [Nocardioidaceae bacterium]
MVSALLALGVELLVPSREVCCQLLQLVLGLDPRGRDIGRGSTAGSNAMPALP